jgi:KDO2-lipid IV(A) lauroyltransferase
VAPHPAYVAYRAGSAVARALPASAVLPFSKLAGRAATRAMSGRAAMAAVHQRRARPELSDGAVDDAVRDAFGSYARYWVESFRLPGTSPEVLDAGMRTEHFERIETGLEAGKGVIAALPHLGGWEWGAFWLTRCKGIPVTAVVEPVQPPELARWFVGLREALGMEIVPLGPDAGTAVTRALKANHIVALLCDRDVAGGGVEVEFFGERTTLPAGPATLALRTGAALLPAAIYFDGAQHVGVVRPAIDTTRQGKLREDVGRITQVLAGELEVLIRRAPDQWHLLQPNWPSDAELDPSVGDG